MMITAHGGCALSCRAVWSIASLYCHRGITANGSSICTPMSSIPSSMYATTTLAGTLLAPIAGHSTKGSAVAQMACESIVHRFGSGFQAPFLPAVPNRLLLRGLSTVIVRRDFTYGVTSARCTQSGARRGFWAARGRARKREVWRVYEVLTGNRARVSHLCTKSVRVASEAPLTPGSWPAPRGGRVQKRGARYSRCVHR